ncbi:MAG: hypothetical protein L0H96_18320 [Humibacillus sp.]|nr:hypothetical protein [Humibacillus sp.]MDN5778854.1 hypothetical protein [Humibacillus sp.]
MDWVAVIGYRARDQARCDARHEVMQAQVEARTEHLARLGVDAFVEPGGEVGKPRLDLSVGHRADHVDLTPLVLAKTCGDCRCPRQDEAA